jgi:quercetin dioxygenase-like cupin family protein
MSASMRRLQSWWLLVALSGCSTAPAAQLLTPAPPRATAVTALAAESPLAPRDNIRPAELQHAENVSVSLVQIRDREQAHVHARYDLVVTLAKGAGTLWLNGTPLRMRAGDVAFIPKGTPHYFVNDGREPAVALVAFAPPFSGPDQQPVPSTLEPAGHTGQKPDAAR